MQIVSDQSPYHHSANFMSIIRQKALNEFAIFDMLSPPPPFERYPKKLHHLYRVASHIRFICSVRTSVSLPGNIVGIVSQVA